MLLISRVTSGLLFKPRDAWISKVKPVFSWKIIFTPFLSYRHFLFFFCGGDRLMITQTCGRAVLPLERLIFLLDFEAYDAIICSNSTVEKRLPLFLIASLLGCKNFKIITFWGLMVNNSMRHVWKGIKWAFLAAVFHFHSLKSSVSTSNFHLFLRKQKVFFLVLLHMTRSPNPYTAMPLHVLTTVGLGKSRIRAKRIFHIYWIIVRLHW
jgi:hypothetical protein